MKFGKLLKETTEGMGPEMTDLFVRYKELKKYLKAMKKQKQPAAGQQAAMQHDEDASHSGNQGLAPEDALSADETAFVNMLNEDLLRFNRFFIDKEEDSVIKLQTLSDRINAASSMEQLQALRAELVDCHGALLLRQGCGSTTQGRAAGCYTSGVQQQLQLNLACNDSVCWGTATLSGD
eukprot:GHRQ01009037.1.p1 GENE.GHRQ01009037.1~~GHRQ01009037.1.p1  ORF type:complete len:179 (+),score=71.27 GHRQ01009037.1:567-1103(+)